jgi:hypothetical protein
VHDDFRFVSPSNCWFANGSSSTQGCKKAGATRIIGKTIPCSSCVRVRRTLTRRAGRISGVDIDDRKAALATQLGMTEFINPKVLFKMAFLTLLVVAVLCSLLQEP